MREAGSVEYVILYAMVRRCAGRIPSIARYLATVRLSNRKTLFGQLFSQFRITKGVCFHPAIRSFKIVRTFKLRSKKDENGMIRRFGSCTVLLATAREMVDSWTSSSCREPGPGDWHKMPFTVDNECFLKRYDALNKALHGMVSLLQAL
jgi:hypothetical protein